MWRFQINSENYYLIYNDTENGWQLYTSQPSTLKDVENTIEIISINHFTWEFKILKGLVENE